VPAAAARRCLAPMLSLSRLPGAPRPFGMAVIVFWQGNVSTVS